MIDSHLRVEVLHDCRTTIVFLAPPANRKPTPEEVDMLCSAFGCEPSDIVVPTPPLCIKTIGGWAALGLGLSFFLFMLMVR